jgi:hypothetical protein
LNVARDAVATAPKRVVSGIRAERIAMILTAAIAATQVYAAYLIASVAGQLLAVTQMPLPASSADTLSFLALGHGLGFAIALLGVDTAIFVIARRAAMRFGHTLVFVAPFLCLCLFLLPPFELLTLIY